MIALKTVIDLIGWLGALVLLTAYAAVSARKMQGDAPVYQALNLIGGTCLIVNTAFYGSYPSTVVNLVWIGVAVLTLARKRL